MKIKIQVSQEGRGDTKSCAGRVSMICTVCGERGKGNLGMPFEKCIEGLFYIKK